MVLPRFSLYAALLAAAGLPVYIHGPKFYVDTYAADLGAIGTALLLLRLVDVVQDPLLGRLAGRLGPNARSVGALFAAMIMALAMLGLFAVTPPIAPIWWMSICLLALFSSFSFLTILFYARGITQAMDLGENGHVRLAGWRETGALLGVSLATMAPFLIAATGGAGFAGFAVLFALLAIVASVAMQPLWRGPIFAIGGGFKTLLGDSDIRKLLILAFVNAAPVAVTSSLFLFFVADKLGADALAGPLLLLFFLSAAGAAPIWSRIAIRRGVVPTLATGMALSIVAFGWAFFLGQGDILAFAIICVASGAALGADMTLLPAIFAQQVAEKGASEAEAFGLWNFAAKLTLAIGAASVLPILDASGFNPGGENSTEALLRLSLLYAGLPCALKIIAIAMLLSFSNRKAVPCPTSA